MLCSPCFLPWLISLSIVFKGPSHVVAKGQDFLLSHGWAIFHCVHSTSLSVHLLMDVSWFPHRGYGEQCFSEHRSAGILFISSSFGYKPRIGIVGSYDTSSIASWRRWRGAWRGGRRKVQEADLLCGFRKSPPMKAWVVWECSNEPGAKINKKWEGLHRVREPDTRKEVDGESGDVRFRSWEVLYGRKGESSGRTHEKQLGNQLLAQWWKDRGRKPSTTREAAGQAVSSGETRKWRKHWVGPPGFLVAGLD